MLRRSEVAAVRHTNSRGGPHGRRTAGASTSLRTADVGAGVRWTRWAAVLTISAFGPYLLGGVRTEQIAVYGSAMFSIPNLRTARLSPLFGITFSLWVGVLILASIGSALQVRTSVHAGSLTAGLDSLMLPVAALIIGVRWSTRGDDARRQMIDVVAATTCYCLAVNTFVAVVATNQELVWLNWFWGGEIGSSVASRAANQGRFSGVFNQPAEAGLIYSIGLSLAIWRWHWREYRPRKLAIVAVLLVIGGLLSVSKIFLFVGLPVFAVMLWSDGRNRFRKIAMATPAVGLAISALTTGIFTWGGEQQLQSLLALRGKVGRTRTQFLTAGRFGEGSSVQGPIEVVLQSSPIAGLGLRGLTLPYDSLIVEVLVQAGIIGVVLVAVMLAAWGLKSVASAPPERLLEMRLARALLAVVVGAALGIPSLTANRSSALIWTLLGLTLICIPSRPRKHDGS